LGIYPARIKLERLLFLVLFHHLLGGPGSVGKELGVGMIVTHAGFNLHKQFMIYNSGKLQKQRQNKFAWRKVDILPSMGGISDPAV
jgi:hypothetical protein